MSEFNDSYKTSDGGEILIGKNQYGKWVVSSWDKDLNFRWEKPFVRLDDAKVEFERFRP